MASESSVQKSIWLKLGQACRLFRLNSGKAWVSGAGQVKRLTDGSVLIPAARPLALGMALTNGEPLVGQSDLFGWHEVEITPTMVGQRIPVVTAIETKASAGGRKREGQVNFVTQIQRAGGIAGFANSEAAARSIVNGWRAQHGLPPID